MSSNGRYAAPPPPPPGGDRFHNPPATRRHQQILLHRQDMLQRQLLHQQRQRPVMQMRRVVLVPDSSSSSAAERREDESEASSTAVVPLPVVCGGLNSNATNLDRLMESVTPFVQARYLSKLNARGQKAGVLNSLPFFYLEDMWNFFHEWSCYGAGVPLLLNGKHQTLQYFIPYLSGIQVYIDPSNPSSRIGLTIGAGSSSNMQRLHNLSLEDNSGIHSQAVGHSRVQPSYEFFEFESPYLRRPLADKISQLASQNPELNRYKSCDLLPSSWICVAWYPIYRIPVGPTLKNLDASFLTFHSLSTQPKSYTRTVHGIADPTPKISLPVFGLAAYKLKGSIMSPIGPRELEQENSLLQAANNWLTGLEVKLPDYDFFLKNRR